MTDENHEQPQGSQEQAGQQKANQKNDNQEKDKNPKKKSKLILLIAAVVAALLFGAFYVFEHRFEESTDDAAIDGHTVTLSPKVSGYVIALNIDDNQKVKVGDVLLEIDPSDYIVRLHHAQAALDAAKAAAQGAQNNTEKTDISAPSNLDSAKAQVVAAEANLDKAVADLKRMQSLSAKARSQEQLDEAVASEKNMRSALTDAEAKLRSAETAPTVMAQAKADSDQLLAQVKQAEADLAQAVIDLGNTKIISPIDGTITHRSVEKGNYVQPAEALGSLVGDDMWVTANFKETQLTHIHQGQKVKIKIDAYPNANITGKIDSVQAGTGAFFSAFPPENATGNFVKIVQRVPVKVLFDHGPDDNMAIGPGMSVIATVDTNSGDNSSDNSADKNSSDKNTKE